MTWFAVNVIVRSKKKTRDPDVPDDADGPRQLWENIILVSADDPDEATQKASDISIQEAAEASHDLLIDGEPAEMVLVGVRKLREIRSLLPDGKAEPGDLCEITYSELEVNSQADLLKLAEGYDVIVRYVQ